MSRKRRPKVGDVIQLELPSGKYAYGRVLNDAGVAFYRFISDQPGQPPVGSRDYQFIVAVDDQVRNSPLYSVVGHDPSRDPHDDWPPPFVINDILSGAQRIYHLGAMRPAVPGEGDGLEVAAVWSIGHLIERLVSAQEAPDSQTATYTEHAPGRTPVGDPFDNDAAAEWCDALNNAPSAACESLIRATFDAAVRQSGYLEVDEGSQAVAAATVVATQRSVSKQGLLQSASDFSCVHHNIDLPEDLTPLALEALARVESEGSELRDLWEERGDLDDWLGMIEGIRVALQEGK